MLKRVLLAVIALVLATAPSWAQDEKKPKQKRLDGEALFKKLDANGDGKVTKEEFAKFGENRPKGNAKPGAADKIFDRLDANADGSISLEELKKLSEQRKKKDK
jgi:hypothetical protein